MWEKRKYLVLVAGLFLVLTCFCPVSMAEESAVEKLSMEELYAMPLDDLLGVKITTSTLTEKAIIKAPSSMTLITEAEIKRSGAMSLFALLDKVVGIDIRHYFNQGIKTVSMRGISTNYNKVKFLRDGHPVNERMWGNHYYDMPLENVKQVEIVRGPGSALFGTDAFAGIINVITKKPEEFDGTRVDVKYGTYDTKNADITFGKTFEDFSLGINLNYEDADNYGFTTNDRITGDPRAISPGRTEHGERTLNNASLYFEYKGLSVDVFYHDGEFDSFLPAAILMTEDGSTTDNKYGYIEAKYDFALSDALQIKTKASYDKTDYDVDSQWFPDGYYSGIDESADLNGDGLPEYWPEGMHFDYGYEADQYRAEIMGDYQLNDDNTLLVGLFYEYLETKDNYNYSNAYIVDLTYSDYTMYTSDEAVWNVPNDRTVYGFFIQDEWDIAEDWYLVVGGRYDHYDDFGSTFNPRCGLVWTFDQENAGIMKFMYATAFKAPVFSQLYHNSSALQGNPDLDPEELESYEVGLGYVFQDKLKTSLTAFMLKTDDLIEPVATPGGFREFQNVGETDSYGLELESKYEFTKNNYLYVGYAYTNAEDQLTDEDQGYVAEHQFSCGLNLHFLNYLNWNINLDYTGEQPREAGDTRDDLDEETIVDTTIRVENYKGWDLYFTVHNMFDEDAVSPSTLATFPMNDVPEPGRHYTGGISYRF